jgi:zinc transporter ZupT
VFVIATVFIGIRSMTLLPWNTLCGVLTPLSGLLVYFAMKRFAAHRPRRCTNSDRPRTCLGPQNGTAA